jgi:YhcH/YjgK/YiaL family protein
MIYDTLEHMEKYFQKESQIHKALCYAQSFDTSKPDGRYEIEGDSLYALVSSYATFPDEERRFEAHRKYIDVQVLLEGEEKIETSFASDLKPLEEYFEPKDIIFLQPPPDFASLVMRPGYFAVFFPHDIHRPNCNLHGKSRVRKIVLKVRA